MNEPGAEWTNDEVQTGLATVDLLFCMHCAPVGWHVRGTAPRRAMVAAERAGGRSTTNLLLSKEYAIDANTTLGDRSGQSTQDPH